MKQIPLVLLTALLASPAIGQKATTDFSPEKIKAQIAYLASPALRGRGSGTEGNVKAAVWIAEEFKRLGLKPLGTAQQTEANVPLDKSGYFQPFTYAAGRLAGPTSNLSAQSANGQLNFQQSRDFIPSALSTSGKVDSAASVFLGYAISAPKEGRDDYAGIDLHGKVALILPGAPKGFEKSGDLRMKIVTARDKGAVAVLIPGGNGVLTADSEGFESNSTAALPVLQLREDAFAALLEQGTGSKVDFLEKAKSGVAVTTALNLKITLNADVRRIQRTTANIVGMLEGSDPTLKSEFIVIGAHMDHLGMGGVGSLDTAKRRIIHPGADDNASGTAGVLQLAAHFANPATPRSKRSLVFLCFSGEEMGLLGSAHFVANPSVPLDHVAAMLNMDMIGRLKNNSLIVGGSGTAKEFNDVLTEVGKSSTLKVAESDAGFGASDHQSFYLKNIPVLFFFTGVHEDYHKPSDTADKINVAGEVQVLKLVLQCTNKLANAASRPTFVQSQAAQPSGGGGRSFRVTLGTVPNYAAQDVDGVLLDSVRAGSPAEMAGLTAEDVLTQLGDVVIHNLQDYVTALQKLNPGETVELKAKRKGKVVTMKITPTERKS